MIGWSPERQSCDYKLGTIRLTLPSYGTRGGTGDWINNLRCRCLEASIRFLEVRGLVNTSPCWESRTPPFHKHRRSCTQDPLHLAIHSCPVLYPLNKQLNVISRVLWAFLRKVSKPRRGSWRPQFIAAIRNTGDNLGFAIGIWSGGSLVGQNHQLVGFDPRVR